MGALTRQTGAPFTAVNWQPDVTQLLDEHHLVAYSGVAQRRLHFAASLGQFLESQQHVEVCSFYGRHITDLESFCYQLERAVPGSPLERTLEGPTGVVSLLRQRQTVGMRPPARYRYYIWHDADVLVRHEASLFGELIDAMMGVAAESEYASNDLLLIHRCVFVGGPVLDAYADNPRGQFHRWLPDGHREPFWQAVTGLERPPVLRFQIDLLGK
ncbi:MAG: hypothetical protein EA378_00390 [Phycisphaerales bacterium]|nr:MAG: hypothetical protein EA378_00390 [Phycisphaerales bacterium]